MARRPRKVHERRETLELGDYRIPVRIITERGRYNARAAVTSKALIIRLPEGLSARQREEQLQSMLDWAKTTWERKPEAFAAFQRTELSANYRFTVRGQDFAIRVVPHDLRHHKIVETGPGQLAALVNTTDGRLATGKLLPKLLAKHFGARHLPRIAARVHELNARHFQRPINAVKLSDTYGRWGSCSSKGNINLATRLLLAPDEILDAVIIHELAHLVVPNHSAAFWAEVERALPNHKEYDVWLKEHGKELLFRPEPVE